jgi:hypothetical protein
MDCAVAYLQRHWVYDNPSAAAQLGETCHPLQIQLHAMKHEHGENLERRLLPVSHQQLRRIGRRGRSGLSEFWFGDGPPAP